jgi:hypothetical protein
MNQIDEWLKQAGDLANEDKVDEAAELASRVLTLEPNNHKALYVLGSVMLKCGRNTQAQQFLRRVCELMPHDHRGWGQLSISCAEMHRYEEAIRFAEKALAIKKEARTYADASFAHSTANNWIKAREYAQAALHLDPAFSDAIFHLANVDLAEQKWSAGWAGYKVSEGSKWRKKYTYGDTKEWEGEQDAVVMVTGEQGLGDEVMAASVIPDAIRRCKTFILDCDKRIAPLFQRSFPTAIVTPTRHEKSVALPVAPTHHRSLFGLLQLFRNANAEFPRETYLKPSPEYVRMFRELFAAIGAKRVVGIAWSGGFPRTGLTERTAGLGAFLPLLHLEPDALYVSLQYKDEQAEVIAFTEKTGRKVMRLPWATQGADIDVLAGLIAACDEVIGVATTSLHLASAMGVPTTWLANRGLNWVFAPQELLWYPPSARIWRKDRGESWRDCVYSLVRHRQDMKLEAA